MMFSGILESLSGVSSDFWALVILSVLLAAISSLLMNRRRDQFNVPLAVGWPIIGNVFDFTPAVILKTLVDYPAKYGGIVRFSVFNRSAYLVTSSDLVKHARGTTWPS
mmetsp:Transcript_32453/g.23981  ORF Transcript_32453/g.23981 Transcript_32453/m.23981 type:complete len:108 (-) Transcript_32453:1775-2098(-)